MSVFTFLTDVCVFSTNISRSKSICDGKDEMCMLWMGMPESRQLIGEAN